MLNSIPYSMMSRTDEIQSQETNTFFDGWRKRRKVEVVTSTRPIVGEN